ncbi:MAG: sulfatase [Thermoanaerobaculales bacterium]
MLPTNKELPLLFSALLGTFLLVVGPPVAIASERPSILVITVDALRADHLGCYGYDRATSPRIDSLLADGMRFDNARTVEPLTGPAMCSMVTGVDPQVHGATRNGLRMQEGLDSLPRVLARHGWRTAAFIGTWTLKHNLTLLGDHFEDYGEVLNRRRWFGLLNSEATCDDLTDDALEWASETLRETPKKPLFLWTHYIEPHAPYRFHKEFAERLGVNDDKLSRVDRYDTEIADVDRSIGRLIDGVRGIVPNENLVIVFTADHGESLGEHNYWGHGRYLYEPSLRIPMGLVWQDRIAAGVLAPQATLLDIAPTLLELVGVEPSFDLPGTSWAEALNGGVPPGERTLCYQAHKGAVHGGSHDSEKARSKGLLAVAIVREGRKEILRVQKQDHLLFLLGEDPGEVRNLVAPGDRPSDALLSCFATVSEGLGSLDRLTTKKLDEETVEQLRALGYLE